MIHSFWKLPVNAGPIQLQIVFKINGSKNCRIIFHVYQIRNDRSRGRGWAASKEIKFDESFSSTLPSFNPTTDFNEYYVKMFILVWDNMQQFLNADFYKLTLINLRKR